MADYNNVKSDIIPASNVNCDVIFDWLKLERVYSKRDDWSPGSP